MRNFFGAAVAAATLSLATAAGAVTYTGSYSETHNSSDPGLVVQTQDVGANTPFSFGLVNVGDTAVVDLYDIWTNENHIAFFLGSGEDEAELPASVTLSFTAPSAVNGGINGETSGFSNLEVYGFFKFRRDNGGQLNWANNGNFQLDFGDKGLLGVHLDDVTFNFTPNQNGIGNGTIVGGYAGRGTVTAQFELLRSAAPEPATWALMIGGFGMAGSALRRRRALATA